MYSQHHIYQQSLNEICYNVTKIQMTPRQSGLNVTFMT